MANPQKSTVSIKTISLIITSLFISTTFSWAAPELSISNKSHLRQQSAIERDTFRETAGAEAVKETGIIVYAARDSGQQVKAQLFMIDPRDLVTECVPCWEAVYTDWATRIEDYYKDTGGKEPIPKPGVDFEKITTAPGTVAAINAANFGWWANSFVVMDGELALKPSGFRAKGQTESDKEQLLDGEYTAFVVTYEGSVTVRKVRINKSVLIPGQNIQTAISGAPIIIDGKIVEVRQRRGAFCVGDEVDFAPNTQSSFSAIGVTKNGQIVALTIHGKATPRDTAQALMDLAREQFNAEVEGAILLGGGGNPEIGGDAQMWTANSGLMNKRSGYFNKMRLIMGAIRWRQLPRLSVAEEIAEVREQFRVGIFEYYGQVSEFYHLARGSQDKDYRAIGNWARGMLRSDEAKLELIKLLLDTNIHNVAALREKIRVIGDIGASLKSSKAREEVIAHLRRFASSNPSTDERFGVPIRERPNVAEEIRKAIDKIQATQLQSTRPLQIPSAPNVTASASI